MTYKFNLVLKNDTGDAWLASDYIPLEGEPCYDITNKTLKIGDGTNLFRDLADVNDDTILTEITLKTDTDYYVSPAGSDVLGDGTIENPFSTPHGALKFVSSKIIQSNVTVRINVGPGNYVFNSSIMVNHTQANQIEILGAPLLGNAPKGVHYVPEEGAYIGGDKFVCTEPYGASRVADKIINEALVRARYATTFTFNNCHGIEVENTILGKLDNIAIILGLASNIHGGLVLGQSTGIENLRSAGGINLGSTKDACNVVLFGWTGGIFSEASVLQIGGVQIGHCNAAIRDRASHIDAGLNSTVLFNSGIGIEASNSTFSADLPDVYGTSIGAFTFNNVYAKSINSNIKGNIKVFTLGSTDIQEINTDNIVDNQQLFADGVFNSYVYFNNAVDDLLGNGNIDTSTWENSKVKFATDEIGTGLTFTQPFGEIEGTNYVATIGEAAIVQASDMAIDTTNFDNLLSATDSDIQTAFETLDDLDIKGELEKLSEDGGLTFGYRLADNVVNDFNYGPIGRHAVDFSESTSGSLVHGAIGENSFAIGVGASAAGLGSFAGGNQADANGINSFAFGSNIKALGDNVVSIGLFNEGKLTTLLEVGNGIDNSNRANMFEVFKDGSITAPALTNTLITNGIARTLTTKDYVAGEISTLDTSLKGYTDDEIVISNSYTDGEISTLDTSLKGYTDDEIVISNSYTDGQIVISNSYTDDEIATLSGYVDTEVAGAKTYADDLKVTTLEYVDANAKFKVIEETALSVYTPDFGLSWSSDFYEYTLTEDANFNNPISIVKGSIGEIVFKQDAIGGWNVNFDFNYIFADGNPVLNTNPNAINVFSYKVINDEMVYLEFVAGYVEQNLMTINGLDVLALNGFDVLAI